MTSKQAVGHLFEIVSLEVEKETLGSGNPQIPWILSPGIGQVCFPGCETDRNISGITAVGIDSEDITWRRSAEAGTTQSYRAYLSEYPDGRFSSTARILIERLNNKVARLSTCTGNGCIPTNSYGSQSPMTTSVTTSYTPQILLPPVIASPYGSSSGSFSGGSYMLPLSINGAPNQTTTTTRFEESWSGGVSGMAAPDLSRLASPSDHPQSLIGDFDYPAIAKAARQEGRVGFKVFVGTSGKVTSCHIASSSGHPLLDQATCDALKEKMRFVIALNEEGHPVEGEYKDEVIWQLEK